MENDQKVVEGSEVKDGKGVAKIKAKKRNQEKGKGLGERVQMARQYAGLTQKELADRAQISQTAIHKLECGQSRSSRRLVVIAMACGVDPVWLETGFGDMITGAQHASSGPRSPGMVNDPPPSMGGGPARLMRIPVVSWDVIATWREWDDVFYPPGVHEWISLPKRGDGVMLALRVGDDSMEPEFLEGDVLVVNLSQDSEHNRYVVASTKPGGRATFKQLVLDGSDRYLKPLNNRYPVVSMAEDAVVHGVVTTKYKEY